MSVFQSLPTLEMNI
nr:unnamed protein product [Callosobruchus analis]